MTGKGKGPNGSNITEHPLYKTWSCMLTRCADPNYKQFHLYGGKGVKVCERWKSFQNFISDMGDKPSSSHSLDRIDGNGDYEPSNVRWADKITQGRNTSRVKLIEFMGEARCIPEWSELLKISIKTLRGRLKHGWSVEDAFAKPSNPYLALRRKRSAAT